MALSDLTANAVLQAIAEFDDLGRDVFLKKYGFGRSRGYFVVHQGRRYDSKAIAGAAHGYFEVNSEALRASEFSGGDKTVAAQLRELGFEVTDPKQADLKGIPFAVGKLYHRQHDIHEGFGGQERGGIATPDGAPFVFLFTGETGEQFGYSDGWRPDGVFAYTGEGQKGDMTFVHGNRAIRDHLKEGRDLLLFAATKTKGIYSFEGCFALAGWEMVEAPDVDKLPRKAIVFQLVPVAEVEPTVAAELEEPLSEDKSLAELRALAIAAAETPKEPGKEVRRAYYVRRATVKAYVLKRANGRCEACRDKAPFLRMDGSPYLEPHHIKRIADGGPDHPAHVGAVCPTCHRRIHHGADGKSINAELEKYVKGLEQS